MIYLMRHGQDELDKVGGWSDVKLIPEGVEQVKDAGNWLSQNVKVSQIVCSDVYRARATAGIVNEYLNVDIITDSNLREQNKGLLNGMDIVDATKLYPNYMGSNVSVDTVYPNGESLRNLMERIKVYLEKIMCFEDNTLIVTHRGVINMIYYILNNIELDMDKKKFNVETASIHELDVNKKVLRRVK